MNKKIEFKNMDDLKSFINDNLLTKKEASAITEQTPGAFNQSVALGYIKPFYESEGVGSSKVKLYLKSDLEAYRATKKNINKP